jgi:hypothetical protein
MYCLSKRRGRAVMLGRGKRKEEVKEREVGSMSRRQILSWGKRLVLTEDLKAGKEEWEARCNYNTLFCPASPLYM